MNSSEVNKIWFNKAQIMPCFIINANISTIVGARGIGKSEGIDCNILLRNVFSMPRSMGGLVTPSYTKLLKNTLPAVCAGLSRLGYHRDIHYVIGKKPDKKLNYAKPYTEPFDYSGCMYWFNGTIVNFLSFERGMSANSMSLDWIMGFEAKFINHTKLTNEVKQANRGNEGLFDCPWHHSEHYSTDMPTTQEGSWILKYEEMMDKELISCIKATYNEIYELNERSTGSLYFTEKIRSLEEDLQLFRSNAIYYEEFDAFENAEKLGEKYFANLKRTLPPLIFRTSVLNHRLKKVANGFYSSLNESIHYYEPNSNISYLESLDYDLARSKEQDCQWDGDLMPDKPLMIANDYNAAINTMVVGQTVGRELRTVNSFFVKTPKKLKDVCESFCKYYLHFPNRDVIYYYDSTAIAEDAQEEDSFCETVKKVLTTFGFNVDMKYIGNPMRHDVKHEIINKSLAGDPEYLFPTFNKHNNEYLLLAMQTTGVKIDRNGFQKDKSAEKEEDTPEKPDETKTHITDAWDTLWVGANKYPASSYFIPLSTY
jgi:hypothetical protein